MSIKRGRKVVGRIDEKYPQAVAWGLAVSGMVLIILRAILTQ